MTKICAVVHIEGDFENIAKQERVSVDQIFDSLAHDIQDLVARYGKLDSWIDDTFYVDGVRKEMGDEET